jgi:hypothetical protein
MCVYCGSQPNTRDHVPSKVLLDEPFPPELPVVDACESCNTGFSLDEQYLSCFLECVICGTVEVLGVQRTKIKQILSDNSALQRRIEASKKIDDSNNLLWKPETDRIRKILMKLAKGHAAYELYPKLEKPSKISFFPLLLMSDQERTAFENVASNIIFFPEIGSRAFLRVFGKKPDQFDQMEGWIIVQPDRYRYAAIETGGVHVRMVLSEYLACEVTWDD